MLKDIYLETKKLENISQKSSNIIIKCQILIIIN